MDKNLKIILSIILFLIGVFCLSLGFNSILTRKIEISDTIRMFSLVISLVCFTGMLYLRNNGNDRKYIFLVPLIIVIVAVVAYILFKMFFI